MNNYEKLKTLCHQNYIGSEKCGECEGEGYIDNTNSVHKQLNYDCTTCQGKGYRIPLEYEALYMPYTEREDPSKYGFKSEEEAWLYIQSNHVCSKIKNEPCESCMAEWIVSKDERPKPLTTTMVLRLLSKTSCYINAEVGTDKITVYTQPDSQFFSREHFDIDLTKDLKDQPETLQAIIDIVNL